MFAALSLAAGCLAQEPVQSQPAAKPATGPKLDVNTSVWDFGEKWAGEEAKTTITLKNVGDAPLKIEKVKSSCGCTVAQVTKKLLEPGESEDVKVTYNTKKRAARVSQKIRVNSNDPASPVTVIEIKGRVKQLVELSEARGLNFGPLGSEDMVTKSIDIECTYTEPLSLTLKAPRSDSVAVRLEEIEAGKQYRLIATTTPPLRDGPLRANVRLLTGVPLVPEVEVRIWGNVQPLVAVAPKAMYVSGQSVQRSLRVTSRREGPLKVTGVTASDPVIKVKVLPPAPAGEKKSPASNVATLLVTLPAENELPAEGATITITTNDEQYSEFVVPVRKRAQPRRSAATIKDAEAQPKKTRVPNPPKKARP